MVNTVILINLKATEVTFKLSRDGFSNYLENMSFLKFLD